MSDHSSDEDSGGSSAESSRRSSTDMPRPSSAEVAAEALLQAQIEIMMHNMGMVANGVGVYHRRAFGRGTNPARNQNQNQPPNRINTSSPSAYGTSSLGPPSIPAAPPSPSLTQTIANNDHAHQNNNAPPKIPLFFREDYAGFIVKGNFMTLAAKPHLVEEGEWLAHQMVEQNRLLSGMLKCVETPEKGNGRGLCTEQACPTMSAGPTTYTWIDTNRQPINLPAPTYIKHIQTWVNGKIQDPELFPTGNFSTAPPLSSPMAAMDDPDHWMGKTSGFPERFETEIKNMYKQMFRCYAHLYFAHWLAFWDTSSHRDLNTCFVHFVNVGRIYGLLMDKDMEPMQPLIDIWVRNGVLPEVKQVKMSKVTLSGGAPING